MAQALVKTCREIQRAITIMPNKYHVRVKINGVLISAHVTYVYCDNCGAKYAVFDRYPFGLLTTEYCHSVCRTCLCQ